MAIFDMRSRWIIGITFLTILVIVLTASTLIITSPCEAHILCDRDDVAEYPVYWVLIVALLICMLMLIATLLRVRRLTKKWNERQSRLRTEFEAKNFAEINIYSTSSVDMNASHLINPNVQRNSHLFDTS